MYLELINLYNGVLISFYNTFVGYASNNYAGLLAITYVPAFDIRTNGKEITNDIQAFQDIPHATLSVKPQTGAVPQATLKRFPTISIISMNAFGKPIICNGSMQICGEHTRLPGFNF